ncbi:MAG: 2-methylthioadenine synthetase, partial [Eggerthella sp.]|nr:2-methylthioadenine synthetase [Eggerthella sp.]
MNFAVVNLGCKVNRVESDDAAARLALRGVETPEASADLIVVNTCTVTGEAEKKTRKAVRRALRANDHARVLVTGCAAAIDAAFYEALDERVSVVGKAQLAQAIDALFDEAPFSPGEDAPLHIGSGFRTRVGVKVQDGCDNACTYCIVHVARGRATSRPADDVVRECAAYAR